MKKRDKFILTFLTLFLLNIFISSALIEISQPLEKYSFGDSIYTSVTVSTASVSGSFEINVVCGNQSSNVYKIAPASSAFTANRIQTIRHEILLTKEFIGNASGNCRIAASLGQETAYSSYFFLSDKISIETQTEKNSYNPGEEIKIDINAIKSNGMSLNGFIEISSNITNSVEQITNGKLTYSFLVPEKTAAGRYEIKLFAYDKNENEILNQNNASIFYEINQVASTIYLSILKEEATPGEPYEFAIDLFDQSGNNMSKTILLTYVSEKNERVQLETTSNTLSKIEFPTNATAGKYTLFASVNTLATEKIITLRAIPKLDIQFLTPSPILAIKNIGNAPYDDILNVKIQEETISIPLKLSPNQEKRFTVQAPDGEYMVTAQSGENSFQQSVPLTGKAISVREGNGTIIFEASPIIWFFVVGIFLLLAIVIFMKNKKRTFKFEERHKPVEAEPLKIEQLSKKAHMEKQFVDISKPQVKEAESNISMKGSKDLCSVISLNIKNKTSLGIDGQKKLNEILEDTNNKLATIDMKGQHVLLIFSPLITKTFDNEIIAVKAAIDIKNKIDEYNKRFNDKISYNIGVHEGEMINSLANGKLNYTSLGNSIILAKRISDIGTEKVLVSGKFRQKLIRELKVQKINHSLGEVDVFEVQKVADTEANAERLKQLLKRTSFS